MDFLLLFFIGIFAAIIGVMFGAAGFVLLPAMLLFGIPIHTTIAANKFATGISSLTTALTLILHKKGSLKKMSPLMLLAVLGGISGAFLATRLSDDTMNIVACIILIAMFFVVLKGTPSSQLEDKEPIRHHRSITPFFIGIYDGGFGPGSALMNITYFLKQRYSYVQAAEHTRFLMFASCMGAFGFYYFYGIVHWDIAIPVTLGSIVGSHIGMRLTPYLKGAWLRWILPIIFLVLIGQVLWKLV